jgi:hypothetical protein
MKPYITLAKWLARKAVKAEWKSMGRNPLHAEPSEIATATNVYFMEHWKELLNEAKEHPVAIHYRQQEQIKLARKAVIAEIKTGRPACHPILLASSLHWRHWLRPSRTARSRASGFVQ